MTAPLHDRYSRWQALAIAQLSVAVALLSALSVAGLGIALSLVQSKEFMTSLQSKTVFAGSFVFYFVCAICSCAVVVTRALDFRLTARTVRKRSNPAYDKPLTIFWLNAEQYGSLTWGLFWVACLAFLGAGGALAASVASVYGPLLFGTSAA